MSEKIIIVFDCGATNIRAVAMNQIGQILAKKSFANHTSPDPYFRGGQVWDVDLIWKKLMKASQAVLSQIDNRDIIGITVSTFGVDGAPMSSTGKLLYPVISWACQRTKPIMDHIDKYISLEEIYQRSGVNAFSFNTINKMIWLKENRPEILNQMDHFVLMPSILNYRLTGEYRTDKTMAGTTMMTDIHTAQFSNEIFQAIGIENKFPEMIAPGSIIGKVNRKAAEESGIPIHTPVISSGHDTQFAIFGSGAKENEVVLSSGTWEILMARSTKIQTNTDLLKQGVTIELDAISGWYNPGIQWLGSGILERIKVNLYASELDDNNLYEIMISEAEKYTDSQLHLPLDFINMQANLEALGTNIKRGEIYRAALEALVQKTKESLHILEKAGGFKADSLMVVGGGSKNGLWNQLRANHLKIPIKTIGIKETTVLGAALFAFYGLGYYQSPQEARANIEDQIKIIEPK